MNKTMLVYENQLEFKKYAYKNGLKRKYDFYFDDAACVDAKTSEDIPEIETNNGLTFEKALKKLIKYYKNKDKRLAKEKAQAKKDKEKAKKLAKKEKEKAKKAKLAEKMKTKDAPKKRGRKPKAIMADIVDTTAEIDINKIIQKELKTIYKNIKACKTQDEATNYIKSLGKKFTETYNVELIASDTGVDVIITFKAISLTKTRKPWKQPKKTEIKKAFIEDKDMITAEPLIEKDLDVFANATVIDDADTTYDPDNMSETSDMMDNEENDSFEEDDEFNDEEDRFDNEQDEDKVDYRRDYFENFDDDGEVSDDY